MSEVEKVPAPSKKSAPKHDEKRLTQVIEYLTHKYTGEASYRVIAMQAALSSITWTCVQFHGEDCGCSGDLFKQYWRLFRNPVTQPVDQAREKQICDEELEDILTWGRVLWPANFPAVHTRH
jgi:hypothetical protein